MKPSPFCLSLLLALSAAAGPAHAASYTRSNMTSALTGGATLSNYASVTLSSNRVTSAYGFGGVIQGEAITLNNNTKIQASDNTLTSLEEEGNAGGGVLYGYPITLNGNGTVLFSGNKATATLGYAYGGAVNGSGITMQSNTSLTFSSNAVKGYEAQGGAVYAWSDPLLISDNKTLTFSSNSATGIGDWATARGGALCLRTDEVSLIQNNTTVTFSDNTVTSTGTAAGGALAGNSVDISHNGTVTFSGNAVTGGAGTYAYGGAIAIGVSAIDEEDASENTLNFEYNTSLRFLDNSVTSSSDSDMPEMHYSDGGAIYIAGSLTFSHNTELSFARNVADGEDGGAICVSGVLKIANNDKVSFTENAAGQNGGAISLDVVYSGDEETVPFICNNNGTVLFSGNKASSATYAEGGALSLSGASSFIGNGTLTFSGNSAAQKSGNSDTMGGSAAGGAITFSSAMGTDDDALSFRENATLTFSGNSVTAVLQEGQADGGAVYSRAETVFEENTKVLFENNSVSGRGMSSGGALRQYAEGGSSALTFSRNDSVTFQGNTVTTRSSDACTPEAMGGAVNASHLRVENNGTVTFSGNKAVYSGTVSADNESNIATGGAIVSGGEMTFTGNDSVVFTDNVVQSKSGACGGAIGYDTMWASDRATWTFSDNDSVLFQGNVEITGATYRLRSIYAQSATLSLSAGEGQTITFRDSIYADEDSYVTFNEDGAGEVIFTGATTAADLQTAIRNNGGTRNATQSEIEASRTSELLGNAAVAGGTLRIEDGAIVNTRYLEVGTQTNAQLTLQNATLNAQEGDVSLYDGATLTLSGSNQMTAQNLFLNSGSCLTFNLTSSAAQTPLLTLTGSLVLDSCSLQLNMSGLTAGTSYKLLTLTDSAGYDTDQWTEELITLADMRLNFDDFSWNNGTLTYTYAGDINRYSHSGKEALSVESKTFSGFDYVTFSNNDGALTAQDSVTFSDNDAVSFVSNTAESAWATLDIGDTLVVEGNQTVTFSDNAGTLISAGTSAIFKSNQTLLFSDNAGAIQVGETLQFTDNTDIRFSGNGAEDDTFYSLSGSEVLFDGNDSVTFENSGAIRAEELTFSDNGQILFSSDFGEVSASGEMLFSGNDSVTFSGNQGASDGGAIGTSGNLLFRNNEQVIFRDNCSTQGSERAFTYNGFKGGLESLILRGSQEVICTGSSVISNNILSGYFYPVSEGKSDEWKVFIEGMDSIWVASGDEPIFMPVTLSISFESSTYSTDTNFIQFLLGKGGVSDGASVLLEGPLSLTFDFSSGLWSLTGTGYFDDSFYEKIDLDGDFYFSTADGTILVPGANFACMNTLGGGAIMSSGEATVFSGNEEVVFSGNVARNAGGAVRANNLSFIDNTRVSFTDNVARGSAALGGAIFLDSGTLQLRNNGSVLFRGNGVIADGTYVLDAIFAGSYATLIIDTEAGQTVTFCDAVTFDDSGTTTLNETGAGDIIFTGAYTVADLNALLVKNEAGRTATTHEIAESRTSLLGDTTLGGGRLRIEDGAIVSAPCLTVSSNTGASIVLSDGTLQLDEALTLTEGTSLAVQVSGTLSAEELVLEDGAQLVWTDTATTLTLNGELTLEGAAAMQIGGKYTPGTYRLIEASGINGDVSSLTVAGMKAGNYFFSDDDGSLQLTITKQPVAWSLCRAAGSVQKHAHLSSSYVLRDDYTVSAPLIWDAAKGKGSFALSGEHSIEGSEFTISGGAYNEKKATFGTGKGVFSIAEDVELDFDTITATAGATVTIEAPLSDTEVGVNSNAKLTLDGELNNVGYTFNGGQIIRPESELSDITLKIDSKTAQNLYVGHLTLTDGANVTVSYTGKNTKPMLAVQGILTLEGGVNVAINTSGATKAVAAHDFVLFQCLGFDGELSSLTLTQKPWSGKLVSAVVNGSYIVAYVQNTAKQKYTKPKALSGNCITFLSRDASKVFTDTDLIISEDTTRNLTWGSTKGKGTFTMSGEGTLSGDTLSFSGGWDAKKGMAKAGQAVYNVETLLDYKRIEAVQGATVHLAQFFSTETTLAVAAGSAKTTLLDVGSTSGVWLDYAGGTIRGNISATGMTATFDKTVKQQNILDGNLMFSGALVVQAAATKITRPVLAVTGTLTLDDVTVDIYADAKQSDFVLFQSRGLIGDVGEVTLNGAYVRLTSYTSGGYNMLAYVTKKSGPKPIKLAACSVTQSAASAADTSLICGEAGGSLLETHELAGGDYAEVLVQSGIAELAEGEVLTAPVISVGTGADEFNATLNNSGTLNGAVEITKNASIDNQGTITAPVAVGGTLNNDGSISGAVTVDSGATLRGSGSISALTLADGAILSSTGDTMTVGSLTLGGETVVSLYLEGVSGAVSRELLKADSVSGEGTWSLTLSGASMEDVELVWEDGVLTLKGTAAEQQTLVAAPATAPDTRVPQLLADSLWAVTETTKSFVNNALRQYRDCAAGKTTAYASALGSFVNMSGFTANGGGGAVGVEHNVAEGAALGLSLGYTDSKLKGDGAAIDQDSTRAAVYTDIRRGAWGLQAYAAYGDTENKLRGSRAEFDTDDYAAGATTSWSIGCVSLFSGLRYAAARADVADGRMQVWQLPVGATVSKQYGKLITSATAAYVGDLARQNPRVKAAGESIRGANPGRSGFELNLGATYLFSDSWSASANYALETRSRATSQSVNASVRYSF